MADKVHLHTAAQAERTVRVSMPAAALYDFDRFVEIQKKILDILGCPCTSGFDIRYDFPDRFVVDAGLNVHTPGVELQY